MTIRPLTDADLNEVAALLGRLQSDPAHHVSYLASDPAAVAAELAEIEPAGIRDGSAVVEAGRIVAVLVAEHDTDPPRVWWHGPFVDAEAGSQRWHEAADGLYAATRPRLPSHVMQEELAVDVRHGSIPAFADRHGFVAEEASAGLRAHDIPAVDPGDLAIEVAWSEVPSAVVDLHDNAFPGTHRVGTDLAGPRRPLIIARRDDAVLGYVAVEIQSDGDGYIDFLAVDPAHRGERIGSRLVAAGARVLLGEGCPSVHLTVRESNAAARALYASLGFVEEEIARPYRKGFTLAD